MLANNWLLNSRFQPIPYEYGINSLVFYPTIIDQQSNNYYAYFSNNFAQIIDVNNVNNAI
jgi:hypothetical protein